MEAKQCKWCNTIFESKTANFCSVLCRNRSTASKNDYESISKKLKYAPSICKECGVLYEYISSKKFCSRSCAAKNNNRNRPEEVYKKQSETLKRNLADGTVKIFRRPTQIYKLSCLFCKKEFEVTASNKNQKYCNLICKKSSLAPINQKQKLAAYRRECAFRFNLADFPEEFNFSLIKEHGWYSPKNKKDNLGGVSRDHIISVKFGFENNIAPDIIAHPANCQLLIHNKNVSKYSNCYMTIDELKKKIIKWNKKYPKH